MMSAVVLLAFICIWILYNFFLYKSHKSHKTSSSLRYCAIAKEYVLSTSLLRQIRKEFICEMMLGLCESDDLSRDAKNSTLAMLSSYIESMPNGDEEGVYYALDWGGSNFRVSRIKFFGDKRLIPSIIFHKETIPAKYKKSKKQSILFDYLASILKNVLIKNGDYQHHVLVGFTFSFPIRQLSANVGMLKEWRKGFDIPGVIGQNVVSLMHEAFARHRINATIDCLLHDAVGTLVSGAYCNDNTRIGLIIATGTNIAYIEPDRCIPRNSGIIITECGSFISRSLCLTSIDMQMSNDLCTLDGMRKYGENEFITKMISGTFLGELVRRLIVKIYSEDERWNASSVLNDRWSLKTELLSDILLWFYDKHLDRILHSFSVAPFKQNELNETDAAIIGKICKLIVNRSADLAATLLLATAEKSGLYVSDENDCFVLNEDYKLNEHKYIGVVVDGSVYQFIPRYKERMIETMTNIVGEEIAHRVKMISSKDGSGVGAALCLATKNT